MLILAERKYFKDLLELHRNDLKNTWNIQWNLSITTTFKMQSIAGGSFTNAIYWWLEIHNYQFYHTLSSGAHPGGQWPPGWAPEDRQVKYKAVFVDRFHCIEIIINKDHVIKQQDTFKYGKNIITNSMDICNRFSSFYIYIREFNVSYSH